MNGVGLGLDWRVAVAAVDAALDRHEAALIEGLADDLPRLSRELQAAIGALSRSASHPPREARPALEALSHRASAQQAMIARRSGQLEGALSAIAAGHPAIAARREQRTYAAGAFGR